MTVKKYQKIKLVVVIVVAIVASQSVLFKNYFVPIATMLVASLFLMYLRRQIKGVVADERDYAIGGKAALLAIQIYAWIASISMFLFYSFRDYNPAFEPIGLVLAFSTCILMLLYALIFKYYNQISLNGKRAFYFLLIFILAIILAVVSLRTFSGEDNWVCRDGVWQKHGQPSFPAPQVECK